jgi:septal ring factor EnvC (AmiA/AmiB activator)
MRIGRQSRKMNRHPKRGDLAPIDLLDRRRQADARQQAVRQDVAKARESVALLRDELLSLMRANAEPACALQPHRFDYAAQIRSELAAAEDRLTDLRWQRQQILRELRSVREATAIATPSVGDSPYRRFPPRLTDD